MSAADYKDAAERLAWRLLRKHLSRQAASAANGDRTPPLREAQFAFVFRRRPLAARKVRCGEGSQGEAPKRP